MSDPRQRRRPAPSPDDPAPSAGELVGLLSDPDRLRIVSAIVLGATGPDAVLATTGLDPRPFHKAMKRLFSAGLVVETAGVLAVRTDWLRTAAAVAGAQAAAARPKTEHGSGIPEVESVLSRFLQDGRLLSMPATQSKRVVVLDHMVRVFEPGRRYPEVEVNALLRSFHPDYAMVRRYMVDYGLLDRDGGEYWRSGGTFEV